ncbi:hypothetical protein SSX86_021332 [Deinandra increscens subsp. villosa]|uniref:Homogentisate phytyltransferase n=1 Tax=Deinandra increscens subsp. villosa TaxID=3103831 RepID=A0AAP0CPJ3_9ASTR
MSSRPVLGIISSCLLAIESPSDFTPSFFYGASIGGCLANSFAVSINQVADVEIDKVNKPYLPLASGELSVRNGILLTVLYAILGLCLALYVHSWPMQLSLLIWYALATAYSVNLPLLRWKATPVLTLMAIWSFRGVLFIPIMFYLHAQVYIFRRPLLLSKHAIFSSGLMSIFAVTIALFKDLSDVEGDIKNGIKTFASQLGLKRIFWICISLLEMAFGIAILIGLSSTSSWIKSVMVISHMILGYILWKNASMVDLKRKKDFESFYMLIWKLLYVEYLLMPILRF